MTDKVTTADGSTVRITRAQLVPWNDGDAVELLAGGEIIARARVELEGGGLLHGLVITRAPRWKGYERLVVFWDRYTDRFVAAPLEAPC